MLGAIRKRDILAHPFVTIHCFGWPVFLRVLFAGRRRTFLSVLSESRRLPRAELEIPAILDRCVALEQRAQRIYAGLAERFAEPEPVRHFFESLSEQERQHSELLQLCRELGTREGWVEESFARWRDAVPRLLEQMQEAESSLADGISVAGALRLVIRIETSEINRVFAGAVATTDSAFVRNLQAFHVAGARHIAFVRDRIPMLAPELADECRRLSPDLV